MTARIKTLALILRTMPGNHCAAQRNRMLAAMERLGSVTSYEGSRHLDCYDPRARIHKLRQAGKHIKTVMRDEPTESGVLHRMGVYLRKEVVMLDRNQHGTGLWLIRLLTRARPVSRWHCLDDYQDESAAFVTR